MDADEQYILDQLMDGYRPTRRPPRRDNRFGNRPRPVAAPALAVKELLDDIESVFFREGATLEHVEAVAEPWRDTGLSAPEIRAWLDAGVYTDEPDLAVALATVGFDPRQAAKVKVRYTSGGESMNVISWVRGSTDKAARAADLMNRVVAARQKAAENRAS
ncbi:MAG: hypothetical protein J0I14_10755 [Propionibacteriaceae bacterium]|jgi:hypothetical protein|nr:hypothetical protein [Propionibacteriaceae bacterium]